MLGMFRKKQLTLNNPIPGQVIDLVDVPDPVFSGKMVGEGFAVIPSAGLVYAPFDAQVVMVFKTQHAIGLKSKDGVELLIHVGLDTVELGGEGFKSLVKSDDQMRKGDLLLEFDMEFIKSQGKSLISPVIITNKNVLRSLSVQVGDQKEAATYTLK